MSDKRFTDAGDNEFERTLASLKPVIVGVNRDQLMYLAGQAAANQAAAPHVMGGWVWPAATVVSSITALVLAMITVSRPQHDAPTPVVQPTLSPVPLEAESAPTDHIPDTALASAVPDVLDPAHWPLRSTPMTFSRDAPFLSLRNAVLAYGVERLPGPRYDQETENSILADLYDDEPRNLLELRSRLENESANMFPWADSLLQGENL